MSSLGHGRSNLKPSPSLQVSGGDAIKFDEIDIPKKLTVVDERLEANGLAADQGGAVQGTVVDSEGTPIEGATVTVGKDAIKKKKNTDDEGQFLITKIPAGTHHIIVAADGFASKDVYYHSFTESTYRQIAVKLGPVANVTVRVVDQQGNPLSGVDIGIENCRDRQGKSYRIAGAQQYKSDDNGEFLLDGIPEGRIKFRCRNAGYYYNSVLNEHKTSDSPLILKLLATGEVTISVVSADGKPITAKYIVEIEKEGMDLTKGGRHGSWGGSANIGENGTYTFKNVPPGRYIVTGKPNPGRIHKRTEPTMVKIEGKDHQSIELIAK